MKNSKNQTIFRIEKNKDNPYAMVNKYPIYDSELSCKATGILLLLLSRPDDWKVYESELTRHFSDGISSIRSGIQELIKCGYIVRKQLTNKKTGHFMGYEYFVYEVPQTVGRETVFRFSDNGKSDNGKTHTTNNNSTNNKVNNILRHLSESNNELVFLYLKIMKSYGLKHKKVSIDNFDKIESNINMLISEGIGIGEWQEGVNEYFSTLPKGNDGDILCFLKASKRIFDIDINV